MCRVDAPFLFARVPVERDKRLARAGIEIGPDRILFLFRAKQVGKGHETVPAEQRIIVATDVGPGRTFRTARIWIDGGERDCPAPIIRLDTGRLRPDAAGCTEYGLEFASALAKDNLFAVQFHPEKSAHWGLELLRNFVNWNI